MKRTGILLAFAATRLCGRSLAQMSVFLQLDGVAAPAANRIGASGLNVIAFAILAVLILSFETIPLPLRALMIGGALVVLISSMMIGRRRVAVGLMACLALAACDGPQMSGVLQTNGVSAQAADRAAAVWSTAVADGTLFCKINDAVAAVPGVNVKKATAQSVAAACATAQIIGAVASAVTPVPVPPPATPAAVPIATVTPLAAASVAASAVVPATK